MDLLLAMHFIATQALAAERGLKAKIRVFYQYLYLHKTSNTEALFCTSTARDLAPENFSALPNCFEKEPKHTTSSFALRLLNVDLYCFLLLRLPWGCLRHIHSEHPMLHVGLDFAEICVVRKTEAALKHTHATL